MTAEQEKKEERQHGTRARPLAWRIIGSMLLAGASGSIYMLLHYLNTPASAALVTNPPITTSTPTSQSSKLVQVSGRYARFAYPSFLTPLKQQQPDNASTLAAYGYEYRAVFPWQLTITVNSLPGGLADNDGAYYAMSQDPTHYLKTTETVNGGQVIVMSSLDEGGLSKIAFLFHGTYSADIAVKGSSQQDAAQEKMTFDQVVQSWYWPQ